MCQTEIKMWLDVWRLLGLASWIFITSLNCPCIPGPGRVAPLLQLPSALTFSDQSEQSLSSGPSERVVTLEDSMRQLERGIQSGTLCFHFEVFNTQTGANQVANLHLNSNLKQSCHAMVGLLCVSISMCMTLCVRACICRTYIGGSQVCFSTVRGSPRTWKRTGTETFYPVSYFHSLPVSALLLGSSPPGVVPPPRNPHPTPPHTHHHQPFFFFPY